MPDRFTAATRYECLIAASRELQNQSFVLARAGQSPELLRQCLLDLQDVQGDIRNYETQMLGLWRLTRSEGPPHA